MAQALHHQSIYQSPRSQAEVNSPLVETYCGTFIRHFREPAESNTIKLLINLFTSLFSKIRSMEMNMYEHV